MNILASEQLSKNRYKTSEGYLVCTNAILARTGKQTYTRNELFNDGDNTEVSIDRPYDEVINDRTIASFENKPVTFEHPDEDVNVGNYKDYAVGYVRDVKQSTTSNGTPVIVGNLIITDQDAINAIESGSHTNLSCGYDCDIVEDKNGYYQHCIRGNHVALCDVPRAGITRIVDAIYNAGPYYYSGGQTLFVRDKNGDYYIAEIFGVSKDPNSLYYIAKKNPVRKLNTGEVMITLRAKTNISVEYLNSCQVLHKYSTFNRAVKGATEYMKKSVKDSKKYVIYAKDINDCVKKLDKILANDGLDEENELKKELGLPDKFASNSRYQLTREEKDDYVYAVSELNTAVNQAIHNILAGEYSRKSYSELNLKAGEWDKINLPHYKHLVNCARSTMNAMDNYFIKKKMEARKSK